VGVTYVSRAVRDTRLSADVARRLTHRHFLLALTSTVVMLAIALSYGGQLTARAFPSQRPTRLVNLNAVADPREFEPLLERLFANAPDRQFGARRLFQFVLSVRDAGNRLPNVGAILSSSVTVEAIERTPALIEYKERLRDALARAARAGSPPPTTLPLLTPADLAVLKPSLVVRTPATFAVQTLLCGAVYVASFWMVALIWWVRASRGDYLLLAAAHLLTGVGFAVLLGRPDPLRDALLFVRFTEGIAVGLAVFAAASLLNFRRAPVFALSYVPLAVALLLSMLLLVFGNGPGDSNVKVNLGPVQPIEATRLLLALFLAGYFARRWELLRQIRGRSIRDLRIPNWLNLPRVDYVLPVVIGITAALLFFFLQKDLGPALFVSCVFLATYAIARERAGMAFLGLGILIVGFYIGCKLNISATLAARLQMWQSAWDNGVTGGDQIAQAIWAVSTGGLLGTGLGLGDTRYLPAGHTDLVLAATGEELGFLGLLCVACVFTLIAVRGFTIGLRAANDYGFFLATTVTLFLILPPLVMAAAMLGLVPLTGVVTPFVSYGGSAMVANFAALGILTAIPVNAESSTPTEPFRRGVRYLGGVLGVAAVALIGVLSNVQVLRADDYIVKPYLGPQSDGVRRYQYNQRLLDLAGSIPRGTIYDRKGLPLATDDGDVVLRARDEYRRHGIPIETACPFPIEERCYPLGGAAFHLLGDARNRRNWSASNTSYIERDAQTRLRGFDDRATTVQSPDVSGQRTSTIRRDYRELIPLLRHRYRLNHPDVRTFLDRPRDLTLTIDAPLQARVANIVAKHAARSASGRAAAVVIDPDSGDLLAIASYPFPVADDDQDGQNGEDTDGLLDRARYGLYPPGSTFKLVTAMAALRRDMGFGRTTFTCELLPNGRVGARIPGWGLVRDDVLSTRPHGSIDMHDGIVRSCNACFAQLAVRLGPQSLLDTAALLDISVARENSLARLRATLPQAGYGQGDVVATPLRIVRVAAAIASDGVLREPRVEAGSSGSVTTRILLTPEAAALLGRDLRNAVLGGTGRSLRGHPWRIAGKTGTAQVAGAPSHAWFVGFAPFGPAEKRIAFAVIIENAGYGGSAAAPAAGDIVTAAAASGLVR
jgi:cell division protein FtsW (lipid II flippase)